MNEWDISKTISYYYNIRRGSRERFSQVKLITCEHVLSLEWGKIVK